MTDDERQQVQKLINARVKVLSDRIAQQDEEIKTLGATIIQLHSAIESREQEIDSLKTQLTASQEEARQLSTMLEQGQGSPEKPSYLLSLCRQHFGFESFRAGQEEIINALLYGRDVFCSMPDNYGKTLCYSLPAFLMPGITLVITEKISHEKSNIGKNSAVFTPDIEPSRLREILRKIKNGTCKILFTTPEILNDADMMSALQSAGISCMVLLADGGNFFNAAKSFKKISASLTKGDKKILSGVFTNSTSPQARSEFFKLLLSPLKIIEGFERKNFSFKTIRTEHKFEAVSEIISQRKNLTGVIYSSTPEESYKLRENFRDSENIFILPRILYNENEHHGVDFVIHCELPKTLRDYSQEISCAKNENAECFLLASLEDLKNASHEVKDFCESDKEKNSGEILREYLGAIPALETPDEPDEEFVTLEDYSDFDFGTANNAQKEAVTTTNGPLLIIAGPGTGKTFTLIQRAVFLIQRKNVKPENILLATFTDKAARELITRITQELSDRKIALEKTDTSQMYIGTFHVICKRILEEHIERTGLKKNFEVLDGFRHAYLIMQNFKSFEAVSGIDDVFMTSGKWNRSKELRDYFNTLSEDLNDPDELLSSASGDTAIKALGQAMKIHDDILLKNNCLSFSLLLSETYKLLRDNPDILEELHEKIKYIMVDEYQDTNFVQEQLIFLLGQDENNICVVGDDDQSLYRFRGATVRNILEFPEKFNDCHVVKLNINYRSDAEIIKFFGDWMNNTEKFFRWENFRHPKEFEAARVITKNYPAVMRLAGLNDKSEWHEKILTFINSLKNSGKLTDYNQIAFLFRSVKSKAVQELSQFLENNNINIYSPRSNMFFKRNEILFAIGCLISMFPKYLEALNSGAFKYNGNEPEYIKYYRECLKVLSKYINLPAYADLKKFLLSKRNFHEKLQGYTNYTYSDLLYELFAFMPFTRALDVDMRKSAKVQRPARNLSRLVQIFMNYEHDYHVYNLNAKNLAAQFQLMMNVYMKFQIEEGLDEYESDTENIPSGHVAFMTIHQAKGMEFPIVFIDSLWAYPDTNTSRDRNNYLLQNISREFSKRPEFEPYDQIKFFDFWRLFYVAFSRAQDLLILTCSEDSNTPSKYLEGAYNKLEDADEIFSPSDAVITPPKNSGTKNIYSFTSHILTYEICPRQYKFFRELEFPCPSSQVTFMGSVIHATLEDIHRAAIAHDEEKITEQNILEWFNENYEHLSKTQRAFLSRASRDTAFKQIMKYVQLHGSDWSAIKQAEIEIKAVRENYILEGKIDLICENNGALEIIDFKSGSKPNINIGRDREMLEIYRRQLNAYAYLTEKTLGTKISGMKLYYTGEENNPEIFFPYNHDETENVMKKFDQTAAKIAEMDFSQKAGDMEVCRECVFKYYCKRA